jgi:hypothetical protein
MKKTLSGIIYNKLEMWIVFSTNTGLFRLYLFLIDVNPVNLFKQNKQR